MATLEHCPACVNPLDSPQTHQRPSVEHPLDCCAHGNHIYDTVGFRHRCVFCGEPKPPAEKAPTPVHPIEIRISIGAYDYAGLKFLFEEVMEQFGQYDPSVTELPLPNGCSGGWSGSWSITSTTRDITADEYRAELEAWHQKEKA